MPRTTIEYHRIRSYAASHEVGVRARPRCTRARLAAREDTVVAVRLGRARARAVVALAVARRAGRHLLGAAPVAPGLARAVRRAAARLPPDPRDVAAFMSARRAAHMAWHLKEAWSQSDFAALPSPHSQ